MKQLIAPIRLITVMAAFGLALSPLGSHASRWSLLLSLFSMYSSFRRSHGVFESTVLALTTVVFVVVFGSQLLAECGVSLDPAIVIVTFFVAVTSLVMSWRSRRTEISHRIDKLEVFAVGVATAPLAGAITASYAMSARWMSWVGWGGDFALHKHLIAALDQGNKFELGISGTPTTWHLLAYIASGARATSFEQYGGLIVATLALLVLSILFVALPTENRPTTRLVGFVALPLVFTTTTFFFVVAGFVTSVGSTAFVLFTVGLFLRWREEHDLVQTMLHMSMTTAIAICMWQPQVVLAAVVYIGVVVVVLQQRQQMKLRFLPICLMILPAASVVLILLDTVKANAQGGGTAPTLHESLIVISGICAAISIWLSREMLKRAVLGTLVGGVCVALVITVPHGGAEFSYYEKKIAWSFLILTFAFLARGLAQLQWKRPSHIFLAALLLGTTLLQPQFDNGYRLAKSWVGQNASPSGKFAAIFMALDEANREKTPAVYFMQSGDDYISNLWVIFALGVPSGPADYTLQTKNDETFLCPFIATYPHGVIFTRNPEGVHHMVTEKCKQKSGYRTVDLRTLA